MRLCQIATMQQQGIYVLYWNHNPVLNKHTRVDRKLFMKIVKTYG